MKVTKRKEVVARGTAALEIRRKVGWTRSDWINEVESALAEAFMLFAQARLAGRNGRQRDARTLAAEFDRLLSRKVMQILVHPVKGEFDRDAAFEEAVSEMVGNAIPALRAHVEREFGEFCQVRRGLDDRDLEEFWKRVREGTRALTA
jgi:squalene cyclase